MARGRYDTSSDGQLNMREFQRAAEEFGFGSVAHDIFLELDRVHNLPTSHPNTCLPCRSLTFDLYERLSSIRMQVGV